MIRVTITLDTDDRAEAESFLEEINSIDPRRVVFTEITGPELVAPTDSGEVKGQLSLF